MRQSPGVAPGSRTEGSTVVLSCSLAQYQSVFFSTLFMACVTKQSYKFGAMQVFLFGFGFLRQGLAV